MADPIQTRAKAQRLAEALRANLKRRKEQTRERGRTDMADESESEADDASSPLPHSATATKDGTP